MSRWVKVDLDALQDTFLALGSLKARFEGVEDDVDVYASSLGHRELAGVMEDFGSGWRYHRQKLVAALDTLEQAARDARTTYIQVDDDLARQLEASRARMAATRAAVHPGTR